MSLGVENLRVSMGGRDVVRNVSFSARRGQFVVIVGPNGTGKTTLVKAIAGLLPYTGAISWDGENIGHWSASQRARTLAFLPQGHVAHWPIAARDVVAIGRAPFSSSLTRLSTADNAAIDAALAAVQAESFADRAITELSGGERARVMLARALAVGAPLLIADEPVASLDPEHQIGVMAILAAKAKAGDLVIAISHDLMLAARFADHIIVLSKGEVAAAGTPQVALSAEVLREVFNVEAAPFEAGGRTVNVPWRIAVA